MPATVTASAASSQRSVEFRTPPRALSIQIDQGSYRTFCGVVSTGQGEGGVLVAISRNINANPGVLYEPPSLAYLAGIGSHKNVERANLKWRLPNDDSEHHTLLASLI